MRHTRLPLTSNRTEPRSRSPSCAKRVYVTSPKRHTRHGSCARTARSSQRTQDRMWFDLSSQTATQTQTRRADTRTQTRRRAPRTKQGTTARCGSVPASCATASLATYMPWYLTVLPAPVCSICSCDSPRCASCVRGGLADPWRRVALQQPGAHTCLHLRCQPALFLGPPQSLHAPRHAPRAALLQCPPVSAQCAHQRRHHRTDHTVHPPCGRAWHA